MSDHELSRESQDAIWARRLALAYIAGNLDVCEEVAHEIETDKNGRWTLIAYELIFLLHSALCDLHTTVSRDETGRYTGVIDHNGCLGWLQNEFDEMLDVLPPPPTAAL